MKRCAFEDQQIRQDFLRLGDHKRGNSNSFTKAHQIPIPHLKSDQTQHPRSRTLAVGPDRRQFLIWVMSNDLYPLSLRCCRSQQSSKGIDADVIGLRVYRSQRGGPGRGSVVPRSAASRSVAPRRRRVSRLRDPIRTRSTPPWDPHFVPLPGKPNKKKTGITTQTQQLGLT